MKSPTIIYFIENFAGCVAERRHRIKMERTKKLITKKRVAAIIWMLGILALFCITRFWRLDRIPGGMHIDEAGMAYDAWSLSEYGVDRYLKSWPVYLTNFGGGQSSLYAFLCALLFKCFGYSLLMVRMPAIIFSFLNVVFGMKIMKRIFPQNTWLPYIFGSLAVICPVFIMASRFGLDCNLMLGMSTVFLYYFICAMDSGKWQYFCMAGFTGGLVLYTYALSYIVMPIMLLLSLLYAFRVKRFTLKNWVIMAIPMGILAFPLIMVQIINAFDLPEGKLGIFTLTKLTEYRASELGPAKWEYFVDTLKFLFTGDGIIYNSIPEIPVLYGITNVFFLVGLWSLINRVVKVCKEREHDAVVYILGWFVAMIFLSVHTDTNVNKLNAVYCVTLMIGLYGMKHIFSLPNKLSYLVRGIVLVGYAAVFFQFANYYYRGHYMAENSPLLYFYSPAEEACEFIANHPAISGKVTQMAQHDIFFAVSARPSPYDYHSGEAMELFICNGLSSTSDEFNYIVEDKYAEFMQELRNLGFMEQDYEGYSLFYKE